MLLLLFTGNQKPPFSFDDIFNSSLQPRSYSVDWVPGICPIPPSLHPLYFRFSSRIYSMFPGEDAFLRTDSTNNLLLFNLTSNTSRILVSSDVMTENRYYWVSPDLQYVLFAYDVTFVRNSLFLKQFYP